MMKHEYFFAHELEKSKIWQGGQPAETRVAAVNTNR